MTVLWGSKILDPTVQPHDLSITYVQQPNKPNQLYNPKLNSDTCTTLSYKMSNAFITGLRDDHVFVILVTCIYHKLVPIAT